MTVVVKPSNDNNSKKSSFTSLISFIVNNSYTRAFFTMCMLFMYVISTHITCSQLIKLAHLLEVVS